MKLFGRKIVFPEKVGEFAVGESSDESGSSCGGCSEKSDEEVKEEQVTGKDQASGVICEDKDVDPSDSQESQYRNTSLETEDTPKLPTMKEEVSEDHTKTENEESDATNEQKTLKKPDKIVPCPRCNSMETKFCYYNNYNVNQPRHFCKSCQRYWTAGGTMRNVPVGAARRKSKNSASHCGHITISEAFHVAKIDSPNGVVLSFGPDSSLYESMSSALNLAEKRDGVKNGYYKVKNGYYKANNTENGHNCSFGSSVTTSNSVTEKNAPHQSTTQNVNGIPTPVSCIPDAPWPVPWHSAIPFPTIYPVPFYPPPYWNCAAPRPWWLSVPSPNATGSDPSSPLGKHSRNGELLNPEKSCIVVPKTLRIDDPEEAAKSSIWSTLGIKYDGTKREGLFKALQPKSDSKKLKGVGSPAAFHANPAALSRSMTFQESVPN